MKNQTDDYDSPWKEMVEGYLEDFMKFFFPIAAEQIDWDKGYTFLDKEFQQVIRDAEFGRRLGDKLVKVWRKTGEESWVLIHIEIQGYFETDFMKRLYTYNYRIFDCYSKPVVSMAILADDSRSWNPGSYGYELWGFSLNVKFPTVKLIEYGDKWEELEDSMNPFAIVTMAHLKTKETKKDIESRRHWKVNLVKMLYKRGYSRENVINLFRFIDWLMVLPKAVEEAFWDEISIYEEERKMPYVTSVEKIGIRKGIEQGIQQGIQRGIQRGIRQGKREGLLDAIELGLSIKFGSKGVRLMPLIDEIQNVRRLIIIKDSLKVAEKLEDINEMVDN